MFGAQLSVPNRKWPEACAGFVDVKNARAAKRAKRGKERALPGLPPLDLLAFLVVILAACDDESIELSSRAQALATETFPAPLGPMPRHSALLKLPLTIVVCAM